MKKILPVNINPYIRTYIHHGFLHSIIGAYDKVLYNITDDVACVKIKNYSKYSWDSQVEKLRYDTVPGDTLKFYGNKWNIDMNAAFWRKCNAYDEIEICINNQLYTNVWASICLFLTSNTKASMTDIDTSYNFMFGNFSKDGVFYKFENSPHTVLCDAPTFPLTIRLVKTETHIILIHKDAMQKENKITLEINENNCSYERIGFGVNLNCNSYYEWVFSNYINFYVNGNNSMPIDYLCSNHKNWDCHTYNYFIDFNIETEKNLNIIGYTLIDYIKKIIDLNKYVEILINDSIHLKNDSYDFFHQDLIYGYDDIEGCFHLLYYNNGKACPATMLYIDFLSKRNFLQNRTIYIYDYNPGGEHYKLSTQHMLQVFKEYRDSQNITYYEFWYDNSYNFGINGINSLFSNRGQKVLLSDIRVSHLLYERSRCNYDRVEYLYYKNILDEIDYKRVRELSQKTCNLTLCIRNLIIKKILGGKANQDTIMNYLKEYISIEKKLTDDIIYAIEKSLYKKNS